MKSVLEDDVFARLERARGARGEQRARVAELERASSEDARRLHRARARLADFLQERERKRGHATDVGEPTEEELVAAVVEAEGGVTVRADVRPLGDGLTDVELVAVNARGEALLAGARAALSEREAELSGFIRENLQELAAGRARHARQVQQRAEAAHAAAQTAMGEFERERRWWTDLANEGGLEKLIADIPANPLAAYAGGPPEVPLPMPESFTR